MKMINLHTHIFSNQANILEIVNQYPLELDLLVPNYSIGIHPWKIDRNTVTAEFKIIETNVSNKNCIAIGECGLDKRIEIEIDLQIEIFEKQVLLAIKHQKPLILHCVAAFQEIIAIKKKLKIDVPIVIHGFSKNKQIAKQLLENGFYLSFGKYLIQNKDLESVFNEIPNDRFFLETDSSDYSIEEIYTAASKYKNIEIENLKTIINDNFNRVFKKL